MRPLLSLKLQHGIGEAGSDVNLVLTREQETGEPFVTVRGIKKELPPLNLIGPQVRKLRDQKGWTQEVFAGKLQLFGWDISRESLAKLENQLRRVPDGELLVLAKIMGVSLDALFPAQVNLRQLGPQFRVRLSHKFKRAN